MNQLPLWKTFKMIFLSWRLMTLGIPESSVLYQDSHQGVGSTYDSIEEKHGSVSQLINIKLFKNPVVIFPLHQPIHIEA